MGLLDKLLFWRDDDAAEYEVDGCFTLPGAELDGDGAADACAAPVTDQATEAGA